MNTFEISDGELKLCANLLFEDALELTKEASGEGVREDSANFVLQLARDRRHMAQRMLDEIDKRRKLRSKKEREPR